MRYPDPRQAIAAQLASATAETLMAKLGLLLDCRLAWIAPFTVAAALSW
jgi:hypothetical protein